MFNFKLVILLFLGVVSWCSVWVIIFDKKFCKFFLDWFYDCVVVLCFWILVILVWMFNGFYDYGVVGCVGCDWVIKELIEICGIGLCFILGLNIWVWVCDLRNLCLLLFSFYLSLYKLFCVV